MDSKIYSSDLIRTSVDTFVTSRAKLLNVFMTEKIKELHLLLIERTIHEKNEQTVSFLLIKKEYSLSGSCDDNLIQTIVSVVQKLLLQNQVQLSVNWETIDEIALTTAWQKPCIEKFIVKNSSIVGEKINDSLSDNSLELQKILSFTLANHSMKNISGVRALFKDVSNCKKFLKGVVQEKERSAVLNILEQLEKIIKHGLNYRDENGRTPVQLAASEDDVVVLRKLIERGADLTLREPSFNATVLHVAVFGLSPDCVEEIMSHAPQLVWEVNNKGSTAEGYATYRLAFGRLSAPQNFKLSKIIKIFNKTTKMD